MGQAGGGGTPPKEQSREPVSEKPGAVSPALPEKVAPPEKPRPIMLDLATARELGRLRGVDMETGEITEPEKMSAKVRQAVVATWRENPGSTERLVAKWPEHAAEIRELLTRLEEGTA